MGIPVDGLIAQFDTMYHQHWRYEWGAAERGCVDCSGAFVWAYRQFGKSIAHGSNAIARQYVRGILPIAEARPGMAAFKARKPGQSGYDLPGKYKQGGSAYNGDVNDYYHIGLVDSTGKYVLNAQSTSTGFVRSPISKGWTACGLLKAVDYQEESEVIPMETMRVVADRGKTVNVRDKPEGEKIGAVRVGDTVQAGPEQNGWRQIEYLGKTGYMMSKFLTPVQVATGTDLQVPVSGGGPVTITLPYEVALALREALVSAMGVG